MGVGDTSDDACVVMFDFDVFVCSCALEVDVVVVVMVVVTTADAVIVVSATVVVPDLYWKLIINEKTIWSVKLLCVAKKISSAHRKVKKYDKTIQKLKTEWYIL